MHSEGGVMNWVIGVLCLVIAMPNKEGINPAFARSGFMQMLYPTVCLGLLVAGAAMLLTAGLRTLPD
jgi:hypothetical protein